jgi:very-short-patch-repair endonuclease
MLAGEIKQIIGYYFADFYCHEAALVVENERITP